MNKFKTSLILSAFVFSGAAFAMQPGGSSDGQSRGGQKGQPPAEALTACESSSSGDSCSFEGQRGSQTGTCFAPQDDLPLACKPSNSEQSGGRGRPSN